jgi:hypothetical protein
MSVLNKAARHFFWKPAACVPSLEFLDAAHGVLSKRDVTPTLTGADRGRQRLAVVELAGGKIVGDLRLVATADDVVVGGIQSLFGCVEPQNHYLLHRRRFRTLKHRPGTALLLGAAASDNYYHWMLDSLPRWRMMQLAGYREYDYVLLHRLPRRFQDETLDRLGVPPERRLRCSKLLVHQFERLVVPAMPFPLEEVSPWACAWVRSLFPEKASGPEKIYLRRGAGRRVLANEAELEAALKPLGFAPVQPDQMTVAEQAEFLSSARCIVAPHGAALTNMIFAPPDALLVEVFHPQHKNRCYVNLATACSHRYAGLEGDAINRPGARRLEYTIDVAAVVRTVSEGV